MKLSTLKKKAQASTAQRGHRMKWGEAFGRADSPKGQFGPCMYCKAGLQLTEDPAPNGIGVSGLAVAIDCDTKFLAKIKTV